MGSRGWCRRGGLPPRREQEARARGHVRNPEAFSSPPVRGLCHVSMVFVAPDRWGEGLGGRLVDSLLAEARSRGYDRVQLWTHADNPRARRLYEGQGFEPSGRRKEEHGELIVHYQRPLPQTT